MSSALSKLWYGHARPQVDAAEVRQQRVVDPVQDQRGDDDQRDRRDQQR
jgi:hypothetical protein